MSDENALGVVIILACIWFGWPLHMIAADLRWMKNRIAKEPRP